MSVVVDTGVLLAAADADDDDHEALVIPECAWQVERNVGPMAEAAFVRHMASGQFKVVGLRTVDCERCAALIETYADLGLGVVDASVVTVAENLGTRTLATLNRRPAGRRARTPLTTSQPERGDGRSLAARGPWLSGTFGRVAA